MKGSTEGLRKYWGLDSVVARRLRVRVGLLAWLNSRLGWKGQGMRVGGGQQV